MATPTGSGFRRWSSLLAQAREPMFVLDARVRVLYVNRSWEQMSGVALPEVIGKSCQEIDPVPETDATLKHLMPPSEALAGNPASCRTLVIHRDGSQSWRVAEFLPFHDAEDHVAGFLGIFRETSAASIVPQAASQQVRVALLEAQELAKTRQLPANLVGQGPRHHRLMQQVAAARFSRNPVLIVGESGIGKRHLARTIHAQSASRDSVLLPYDPSGFVPEKLEQEWFRGEPACWNREILPEGCTLLIGDIAKLPRDLQAKLVLAAEDTSVRVLATSSMDAELSLSEGFWTSDFYFAMTAMVIRLDPLRDRLDELPILAQHFLDEACARSSRRSLGILPETLTALTEYDWPGNLRELRRVMEAAQERCEGTSIGIDDLPAAIRGDFASSYAPPPIAAATMPLDDWLARLEKRLIELALGRSRQNKSKAAEFLEISRPRLYRRIKELNIPDLPEES